MLGKMMVVGHRRTTKATMRRLYAVGVLICHLIGAMMHPTGISELVVGMHPFRFSSCGGQRRSMVMAV